VQNSASLVPCSCCVEEDMHSVVAAWRAVKGGGECVPWATAVDGNLLDRLADVGGIV
jgi:hypothetical protein